MNIETGKVNDGATVVEPWRAELTSQLGWTAVVEILGKACWKRNSDLNRNRVHRNSEVSIWKGGGHFR